ncbi:MAG: hypothetical protein M3Z20_15125 [Chloroflexota bacterium]|nr:hypothetical protein [Chloroflexota bacterium]
MRTNALAREAPLAQTYARVRLGNPWLQVYAGEHPAGAVCALAALLDADSLVTEEQFALMAGQYKTQDRDILVRFSFSSFVYALACATVGPFGVDRRVPVLDLDPADLRVRLGRSGVVDALVLPDSRFWCLPDDPDANHPDALPVADEQALCELLRSGLVRACAPLIAALRPRARIGARALWISAAETCASILIDALPPGTPASDAQAAVDQLIGSASSPLRARPEIIMLASGAMQHVSMLGSDCCTNFKIPGETYCATCPHRPRQERIEALQSWLAERAAASGATEAAG